MEYSEAARPKTVDEPTVRFVGTLPIISHLGLNFTATPRESYDWVGGRGFVSFKYYECTCLDTGKYLGRMTPSTFDDIIRRARDEGAVAYHFDSQGSPEQNKAEFEAGARDYRAGVALDKTWNHWRREGWLTMANIHNL